MQYLILDSQINFFLAHGYIEFEDVFSLDEISELEKEIDTLLKSDNSYGNARDLFRKSEILKKITFSKKISSIVSNLTKRTSLKVASDQVFYSSNNPFDKEVSLDDINSFQSLVCAVVIRFSSDQNSLLFISPDLLINFEELFSEGDKFYMVVYGDDRTIYKQNLKDPNVNFLKKFGYAFGDPLKKEFHPIVYKKR